MNRENEERKHSRTSFHGTSGVRLGIERSRVLGIAIRINIGLLEIMMAKSLESRVRSENISESQVFAILKRVKESHEFQADR